MEAAKFAVIDVGSNTIKIKIINHTTGNTFKQVLYKDYTVSLWSDKNHKNEIGPEAMEGCVRIMKKIHQLLIDEEVIKYKAIGTEALRKASNRSILLDKIKTQTGIDIEIISGEREAELTLQAIQIDVQDINFVCINGGGASTELSGHFATGNQFEVFEFGARSLTEDFIEKKRNLVSGADSIKAFINREFGKIDTTRILQATRVFSVGGSIYHAALIIKKIPRENFENIDRISIGVSDLENLVHQLMTKSDSEMFRFAGVKEERMDILLAGTLVHLTLLQLMKKTTLTISTRSIADALMTEFG